jgi:hypothetical protein
MVTENRPRAPLPEPPARTPADKRKRTYQREGIGEAAVKSVLRTLAANIGRAIAKMLTGSRR